MNTPLKCVELFDFKNQDAVKDFIFGNKGFINMEAPSGVNHSYIIERPLDRKDFPPDTRFVYVAHFDDDGQYTKWYLGMITSNRFKVTRSSRFSPESHVANGARYLFEYASGKHSTTPMKIRHDNRCALCGRRLDDDASKLIGYGPKCIKKFMKEKDNWTSSQ